MDKDWLFKADDYICDVRTVGLLINDGHILVQRDADGTEYALPGGHIKIGETLEDGLIREFKEETGAKIICKRMLWSEECFWTWNGSQAHNLAFYYLIELAGGAALPISGEFISQKDNCNVLLGWLPIEKIRDITIYPEFIKEEINNFDKPIRHFVTRS